MLWKDKNRVDCTEKYPMVMPSDIEFKYETSMLTMVFEKHDKVLSMFITDVGSIEHRTIVSFDLETHENSCVHFPWNVYFSKISDDKFSVTSSGEGENLLVYDAMTLECVNKYDFPNSEIHVEPYTPFFIVRDEYNNLEVHSYDEGVMFTLKHDEHELKIERSVIVSGKLVLSGFRPNTETDETDNNKEEVIHPAMAAMIKVFPGAVPDDGYLCHQIWDIESQEKVFEYENKSFEEPLMWQKCLYRINGHVVAYKQDVDKWSVFDCNEMRELSVIDFKLPKEEKESCLNSGHNYLRIITDRLSREDDAFSSEMGKLLFEVNPEDARNGELCLYNYKTGVVEQRASFRQEESVAFRITRVDSRWVVVETNWGKVCFVDVYDAETLEKVVNRTPFEVANDSSLRAIRTEGGKVYVANWEYFYFLDLNAVN
ncbi:MAG: hypothetical protein KAS23_00940 [Anaerohalosphaera sp.]|nr:hypothetical protein [Anaerohalosphaera sp.]